MNNAQMNTTIDIDRERLEKMREVVNSHHWTPDEAEAATYVATMNPRLLPLANAITERAQACHLHVMK